MRTLLTIAVSFCAGAALALISLPAPVFPVLAGLLLILGVLLLVFRRDRELRLALIFLGGALGLLWCWGYHMIFLSPVQSLFGLETEISGVAVDYSQETAYGIRVDADISVDGQTVRSTVWLYTEQSLKPGDRFTVQARLASSAAEGSYDGRSEGIWLYAYGKKGAELDPCDRTPLRYLPRVIAHRLEAVLCASFPEDTLGYAMALTTGNRTMLSSAAVANLKASGIYHALALSGLHMSVLVGMLSLLLSGKKRKALVGIPVCILFTVLTGGSPSIVRACVMQCLLLTADLTARERDTPTSLALAALLLTMQNPWCLLAWGLQLSFLSVIGLELFGLRLHRFLLGTHKKKRGKLRFLIAASLSSSGAAMALTIPLMAAYFGCISLVSPITNLLTTHVIGFCFGGSLLAALLGLAFPPLARVFGWVLSWGFRYVGLVAKGMAKIPFGVLYTETVYGFVFLGILYGVVLLLLLRPGTRKIIPLCCVGSAFAVCVLLTLLEGTGVTVTALDVGQGQCLILRAGGGTVLVDCGGNAGNAGDLAAEYLAARGVSRVDLLILTHYDSDHTGGVPELMERMEVSGIIMPDIESQGRAEIEAAALQHGTDLYLARQDTSVYFGGGAITVFAPVGSGQDNEAGLSILVSVDGTELLVTGDMSAETERMLLAQRELPDVDILVAGHHGSKNSTCAELLETTAPEIVLISVGDNIYGHPAEETLARIRTWGAAIYRTDQNGTITIKGASSWPKEKSSPSLTATSS